MKGSLAELALLVMLVEPEALLRNEGRRWPHICLLLIVFVLVLLVLKCRREIVRQLIYLQEALGKLQDAQVTSELWQDYHESWLSLLALRPKLEAECAQSIFNAIATDENLLKGLAAAHLLKDANMKKDQVPNELLLQLKQGPAKHVKNHAYAYCKKIKAEIGKIARVLVQQTRQWLIAQLVVLIGSCTIGLATFCSRLVYGQLDLDG